MTRRFATVSRREFLQVGTLAMVGAESAGVGRAKVDSSVDISARDLNDLTGQLGV